MFLLPVIALCGLPTVLAQAWQGDVGGQEAVWAGGPQAKYDEGLFRPFEQLGALSESHFTTLQHPLFPDHGVRIKKSMDFCDGTVNAYTGYIDVAARHLFFYFFESRGDPDKDDVVFWTNGGPGGSSAIGLFMELGPCRVNKRNGSEFNPYGWNEHSNIFFVDQPVGVGFSYADYGEYVDNTVDAGKDIAAFSAIFFEHFPKFKGRGYHLAGESYGGRYIPLFATAVYEQNVLLKEAGLSPINLSSIMIGNGCTDPVGMISSYYNMQCQPKSHAPVVDITNCVYTKRVVERCKKRMQALCYDTKDPIDCQEVISYCRSEIERPFKDTGRNVYDLTMTCEKTEGTVPCYPITDEIDAFLNRPDIRKAIGSDASPHNFSSINRKVNHDFHASLDWIFPTQYYIEALLERGVRTLIYVGANDWICNWVGNEKMTLGLQWTHAEAFKSQELRDWTIEGEAAGVTRSAGPLTFATIYGAGHMAPYDQPKSSLELLRRWLADEEL